MDQVELVLGGNLWLRIAHYRLARSRIGSLNVVASIGKPLRDVECDDWPDLLHCLIATHNSHKQTCTCASIRSFALTSTLSHNKQIQDLFVHLFVGVMNEKLYILFVASCNLWRENLGQQNAIWWREFVSLLRRCLCLFGNIDIYNVFSSMFVFVRAT